MSTKASFSRIMILAAFLVFWGAICVLSLSGTSGMATGYSLPEKTMTEVAESGLSDIKYVTISSKEELDLFSDYVNNGNTTDNIVFLLEADIDYNDITTANAWCEDVAAKHIWTPAGTEQHPFAGTFFGNGHTIGGLYINRMGSAGFFGYINGAQVEGLNISDSCFISTGSTAGTIAGSAKNSTVSDCSTNQRFKENKIYTPNQVSSFGSYSYQWYSYNSASVKAVSKVGGLVGYAENTTVENSYSFAFVEGSDEVGGIVGELNGGSVKNCYSKGKLTNTSSSSLQTGGIAGKILNGATVEYGYYFDEIAEAAIGGDGVISPVADTGTVSSFGLNGKLATSIEIESSVCGTIYAALNIWAENNANCYWTNAIFPELTAEPYTALPAGGDNTSAVWDGTTAAAFAGGTGTEGDPYQIATAEQLRLMSYPTGYKADEQVFNGYTVGSMRTAHYILTANIRLNDETFTFIPDTGLIKITDGANTAYLGSGVLGVSDGDTYFDNTASTEGTYYEKSGSLWTEIDGYSGTMNVWVPIGTAIYPFNGVFDGNGYTVSGMYIKGTGAIGLFGAISAGSNNFIAGIKNITVSQSLVRSEDAIASGDLAAGIVSYANGYSLISNCKNGAIIMAKENAGGIAASLGNTFGVRNCVNEGVIIKNISNINYSAGGIIGQVGSPYPIVECANTGDILSSYQNENSNLGGILGASDNYSRALLYHCYNSGNIRGGSVLGGIIGYARNNTWYQDSYKTVSISGCENYGEITGGYNNLAGDNVGGIGGLFEVYSTVSGCNNFGAVSSNTQNAGGILGQGNGNYVFLLSCNNYGDVSANGKDSVANAGGIAGSTSYTGRLFINGLINGLIQTFVACVNFGSVTSPAGYLGGIAAYSNYTKSYYDTINFTFLSYCVNYGEVKGESYTAGIAAKLENILANGCINYGEISSTGICAGGICAYQNNTINSSIYGCVNKGAVSAASQAGGITGAANSYKIENSYNIGTVYSASNYAGGIIGYCSTVPAELYSCYYLAGCATDGLDTVQNAVGNSMQGETTADLSTVKSFAADGTLSVTIDNTDFSNLQSALCHYVRYHSITNASGFTNQTIPGIRVLPLRYNIKVSYNYNGNGLDPRYIMDIYAEIGTNKTYVNYADDTLFTADLYPKLPCYKIVALNKRSYPIIISVIDKDFMLQAYVNGFTDSDGNWIAPDPREYLYAQLEKTSAFKQENIYAYNGTYDGSTHYIKAETDEYDGFTISYQWYKNTTAPSGLIQGATFSTYGVKEVGDSGTYYCKAIISDDGSGTWWDSISEAIVVTINKPAPSILTKPAAANTVYYPGLLLGHINLTGGVSDVPGTFKWKASATLVSVADNGSEFTVVFTPDNTKDYGTVEIQVPIAVAKATPKINTAPTSSAATYFAGITLGNINFKGGAAVDARNGANVAGRFVWKTPETAVSVANDGTSFQVHFVPTDSVNYNEAATAATLHISKASPTVTSAPSTNALDYVFNIKLADFALLGGEGSVPGSFAWTEPNTLLHVENSGSEYSVTFTPTDSVNYNTATCFVQISLNKGINSVISSGYEEEYDGAFHGITVTPSAGTISYSLNNIDWTYQNLLYKDITAEPITVYFKVESLDFVDFYGQQTIEIIPKQLSVSWGALTLIYNGRAQKPNVYTNTGIYGESLTVIVTGEQTNASANAYTATASITDPNYTLTNTSTEFYIAKADYDMSGMTFENVKSVYDGAAHSLTLSGTLPTGHDGIQVTVSFDGSAAATSVSERAVTATFATTSTNYNIPAPMTATITITKADYDMSGVKIENATSVYDGAAHSLTLSGTLPTGHDGIQVTVSYNGSATTVAQGAVTVTATFATTSENYNIPAPMTATITITKADYDMTAVVWDYTNPFIADGTVKTVILLHLPEGVTAQYTGNSAAAANAYTASAVLSGNPNYNTPSVAALEWIINPTVITDTATDITVESDNGFDIRIQLVIEKKTSASGDASALLSVNEILSAIYHARLMINGVEQPAVGTYTIRIAVNTDAATLKVLLYQDGAYIQTTATVENGIAVFVVEKLGEFALVGTETPASANLWWLWLLIALIAATLAAYIVFYLLWKRGDLKPIAFLIPTFRQINKLFYKTEWNDIEIKANQSKTSPKE